jgi:hypothetical protein
LPVQAKFLEYLEAAPKDKYGGCLGDLIAHMPAIQNHMELMAAITQQPSRKDKINVPVRQITFLTGWVGW